MVNYTYVAMYSNKQRCWGVYREVLGSGLAELVENTYELNGKTMAYTEDEAKKRAVELCQSDSLVMEINPERPAKKDWER